MRSRNGRRFRNENIVRKFGEVANDWQDGLLAAQESAGYSGFTCAPGMSSILWIQSHDLGTDEGTSLFRGH